MRHFQHRFGALAATFSALMAVACAGFGVSPSLTAATPNPTPFVGSVFTQCTVYQTDSGIPGRSLVQQEFQISPNTLGACPQYVVLTNPFNSPTTTIGGHYVYYVSSWTANDCTYIDPEFGRDDSVDCKLTAPTQGAPTVAP
jgi:hypothetical protein